MISLLIILFSFLIFLYFVFFLAKDDFALLRKDIPLDRIFSMALLTGFVSLIAARLCFVLFSFKPEFLNPLIFFAIPYYPGLSLMGGVVGGSLFVYFYAGFKQIPAGRLFDLFIMSLISVLPIGLLLDFILLRGKESMFLNIIFITMVILFVAFTKFIFPFSSKGEIKDGSLGLLFLMIISFIYFMVKLLLDIKNFSFLNPENIFILIVFFTALISIINLEIMNKYLSKK